MSRVVWLAVGIAAGFAAAHYVNQTPRGRAFFEDLSERGAQFRDGLAEGYRLRDQELRTDAPESSDSH